MFALDLNFIFCWLSGGVSRCGGLRLWLISGGELGQQLFIKCQTLLSAIHFNKSETFRKIRVQTGLNQGQALP